MAAPVPEIMDGTVISNSVFLKLNKNMDTGLKWHSTGSNTQL
jgi:hypothetical protein